MSVRQTDPIPYIPQPPFRDRPLNKTSNNNATTTASTSSSTPFRQQQEQQEQQQQHQQHQQQQHHHHHAPPPPYEKKNKFVRISGLNGLDLEDAVDRRLDADLVDLAIPPSYKKKRKRRHIDAVVDMNLSVLPDDENNPGGQQEADIPEVLTDIDTGPIIEDLVENQYPLNCLLMFLAVSGHLLSCIFWSLVVHSLCTSELKQCVVYGSLLVVSYLMIFTEAYKCRTRAFLCNCIDYETLSSFVQHIKRAPPICTWSVVCYDIERKKRVGDMEIQRHKDTHKFEHHAALDCSDDVPILADNTLTRLHFICTFSLSTDTAVKINGKLRKKKNNYKVGKREYYRKKLGRTEFIKFTEELHLEDMKAAVLVARGSLGEEFQKEFWMSEIFFWICCLFLLSPFYRVFFSRMTKTEIFNVRKLL